MEQLLSNIQKETLKRLYKQDSYLTILLSIEEIFSNIHLYAYKNWYEAELFEGPNIDKFWIDIKLIFDCDEKPDLDGIKLLKKHGINASIEEGYMLEPKKITSPSDFQPGTRKPKLEKYKIYIVCISIPRNIITINDTFDIDDKIAEDVMANLVSNDNSPEDNQEDIDSIIE